MNQMLKQVQQMQAEMMKAQEELKDEIVEASAGGGMVTVKVTRRARDQGVRSTPRRVDPEDVEMLQDMVLAAINEALRSAQELAANSMGAVTGGLGGPGGLGGLGLPASSGAGSLGRSVTLTGRAHPAERPPGPPS